MKYFYLFLFFIVYSCESSVKTGLDNLIERNFDSLDGKKVGLIINHTSISSNGEHIVKILSKYDSIEIVKIFSPEHGYSGNKSAGENIANDFEVLTGAKIISLYGITKKPTEDSLFGIDVLLYDIQDIGSRYYTYISTMSYMMDIAAEQNIPFIVLDRPNPLGRTVSGPKLDIEFSSFVGLFPIPIRHGMTSGELAQMINSEGWLPSGKMVDLTVFCLEHWDGNQGYFTIPPSPNIPNYKTALAYSGMCLLEGTNISEGRGTEKPFLYFGAPWINNEELTDSLNKLGLDAVRFKSIIFTPEVSERSKWPKYKNQECYGCEIIIDDDSIYKPIYIATQIIHMISSMYPEKFKFLKSNFIDKLYGSKKLRLSMLSPEPLRDLYLDWESSMIPTQKKYLLY